tara:strand:- start:1458 stop:2321 length:864 start_codon:yes stop_codon:yes gene_type:complete
MPELPEVEIVRQSLNKKIKLKLVKKVIVKNRNLRFRIPDSFENLIINSKILKVGRFSKYLILHLSNKSFCLIHLGMSGTIHIVFKNKQNLITNTSFYNSLILPKKHNHVEIFFNDFKVVYNDPRRFGFFEIIKDERLLRKKFSKYGPEPFEYKFNLEYLYFSLKNKEKNIKDFLLDQKFVSGIGNIYASEILYLSKIKPTKRAHLLKRKDYQSIIRYSKRVLLEAIEKGGSSIKNFKDISGKTGNFQTKFKVYQREGLNCKRKGCKGVIRKKKISNRSTFFCNSCQK